MTKKYRVGVDVGGTNVKIALVDTEGSIVYSNSIPTRAEMGYEYTVSSIKQAITDLMKETKTPKDVIEGIGFGFPGQIDCTNGIVRLLPNIPGWVNVPIAKIIEDDYNEQVRLCTGEEDDDGNWDGYDESELITVTPEEIENDSSWSYDCSNGGAGDLYVNYHVLVQRLEIKNDLVNLTNPAGE